MSLAPISSLGDLDRWLKLRLGEYGLLSFRHLKDRVSHSQIPDTILLHEVETDPDPPDEGALVYCIADNGSGKRETRALFPTGAPVPVVTEP